jgi:3-deoxy-D-manno-octulosonate 8-phosphate phosphatase (KDO 8-P phosphatase)
MIVDPRVLAKAQKIKLLVLDVDGVLTDGCLYYDERGEQLKSFYVRDGLGIKCLQKMGMTVAIISGRSSELVYARASDLGIDKSLVFLGSSHKGNSLQALCQQTSVSLDQVAFMGDDWIDLPALKMVGLAACVTDAHRDVKNHVDWISTCEGGKGAVRELCELILFSQNLLDEVRKSFVG